MFWKTFWECENTILQFLHSNHPIRAINLISEIGKKTGYDLVFEISVFRNQIDFKDNKFCLIISPNLNKTKLKKCEELFDQFKPNDTWMVLKYRPFKQGEIHNIKSVYKDVEINYKDIKYHPLIDTKESVVDLLLFIDKDKIDHMCKKEKKKDRYVYIPKDITLDNILLSSVGEYFLLNKIRYMEIYPSDAPFGLNLVKKELDMLFMDCLLLRKSKQCHLCGYYDFNCSLTKKKKYYCQHCILD